MEDLAEDKEGESRLEEEEVFDENEEAVKAPSQLGEDQDAYGRQVLSLSYSCEAKSLSSSMVIRLQGFRQLRLQDSKERCNGHEGKGIIWTLREILRYNDIIILDRPLKRWREPLSLKSRTHQDLEASDSG